MPEEKKLTSTDISGLIQGSFNDSRSESVPIEKEKKRINSLDADAIYLAAAKYNIEDINLSNLQKLHERELINVPFFQKLRKMFNPQMIKSHLMETLGISKSYTGFHEYMKGDRDDIPTVGICNIAKTVGFNVMIIPVPEDLTPIEYARLNGYRDLFISAVEQRIIEANVPVTRAKSKGNDKPKDVNTSFLNNLSKTEEEIMAGLSPIAGNISPAEKIDANAIYDDGSGPIVFDNQLLLEDTGETGSVLESGFLNENVFDGSSLFEMVNMGGYSDKLDDFNKLGDDEDEFKFGEEDEEN